jgi:hypothetical protein
MDDFPHIAAASHHARHQYDCKMAPLHFTSDHICRNKAKTLSTTDEICRETSGNPAPLASELRML